VAGEAALYFDPYSSDDLAAQLQRLLTNPPVRRRLIAAGTKRVKRFSWKSTAAGTLEVFEKSAS
jgi:glycosyltransferase involved in cell wall biosynthesis